MKLVFIFGCYGGVDQVIISAAKDGMALINDVESTGGKKKGIPVWS